MAERKSVFLLRFANPSQRDRVARAACARGFPSLNAYVLAQIDPQARARAQLIQETARAVFDCVAQSPEFDALDASLAAGSHPAIGSLGFYPGAADTAAASEGQRA